MRVHHRNVKNAVQDQMSWQLSAGALLGTTAVQGLRQVADLNVGMLKATAEQAHLLIRHLAAARTVAEMHSIATTQLYPCATRIFDYSYYLAGILARMQSDAIKAVAILPEAQRAPNPLVALVAVLDEIDGWQHWSSAMRRMAESALRFPVDVARAVRLVVNTNVPAWEAGKLRIAAAEVGAEPGAGPAGRSR